MGNTYLSPKELRALRDDEDARTAARIRDLEAQLAEARGTYAVACEDCDWLGLASEAEPRPNEAECHLCPECHGDVEPIDWWRSAALEYDMRLIKAEREKDRAEARALAAEQEIADAHAYLDNKSVLRVEINDKIAQTVTERVVAYAMDRDERDAYAIVAVEQERDTLRERVEGLEEIAQDISAISKDFRFADHDPQYVTALVRTSDITRLIQQIERLEKALAALPTGEKENKS